MQRCRDRCIYVHISKTCWTHKFPHIILWFTACLGSTRALSAVTEFVKFHNTANCMSGSTILIWIRCWPFSMHLMPNVSTSRGGAGGRAKVKVCCMYACMWCLRLCLIISVVTLKMHKCCLNAIQEMQGAKIEMLLPCHVLQLLCPSPINVGVLRAWRWAQGTQFVSCMCLALR